MMELRLEVGSLGALSETPVYQTAVDHDATFPIDGLTKRIVTRDPAHSILIDRFTADPTASKHMPLIGSEVIDQATATTLTRLDYKHCLVNGVLVLDKPAGMSSAVAVDQVKKRLGAARAGHGGTLDPIATGVLPICLDEATKLAQYLLADDKAYEADLLLGVETDTLDRTGTITDDARSPSVTREALRGRARRAHRRAGSGAADVLGDQAERPRACITWRAPARRSSASRGGSASTELELLAWEPPRARIAIACSKGTYVRSLVADLGTDVGCGAHMTELRRTRSGVFTLAMAHDLDRLDGCRLVAMPEATRLPRVIVPADLEHRVRSGVQLRPRGARDHAGNLRAIPAA